MSSKHKSPSIIDALIPIILLIVMLSVSVYLYGDDSSYGANQIALILGASIAALIGMKNGYSWKEMESGIVKGISMGMGAILILLAVGALIGTWIMSGTVPAMIYYGLKILSPSIFYFAACIICALSALSIGSSWTVAGTLGVALIGISLGLGLSPEITAGAIISGAYFGDKMSPLSDTTNLAPAIAGTDLFTHIRHMIWTTGPSLLIALIIFLILGFQPTSNGDTAGLTIIQDTIINSFNISMLSFIPLVVVFILAFKKVPAFPTVLIGALLGGVFAAALASISFSQVTFAGTAQELGAESVIETIKKRGVIKIGLDLFVPWSMRDKNGDLVGFEPDVGRKLAADMGVEVEFIPTKWAGIIPALVAGKMDVIISGMTVHLLEP